MALSGQCFWHQVIILSSQAILLSNPLLSSAYILSPIADQTISWELELCGESYCWSSFILTLFFIFLIIKWQSFPLGHHNVSTMIKNKTGIKMILTDVALVSSSNAKHECVCSWYCSEDLVTHWLGVSSGYFL